MGSCLSKPSSKGHKKKKGEASLQEERDIPVHKKEPVKASGGEAEEHKIEALVPSVHAEPVASSPLFIQVPVPCLTGPAESQIPSSSPSAQKPCTSASLSPDPTTLTLPAQTPMRKKHSGELPINSLRKPSSPCRAILYKMPSSPGGMKKSAYSQRNEEEDCKFPSLARKQWLSQACATTKGSGEDDTLTMGSKEIAGENASKDRTSLRTSTLTSKDAVNAVSKELSEQTSGRLKQESDAKGMVNTSKLLASEAPGAMCKAAASRTNSLSRDLSPVEHSRAKARPSSPLKRSPSIKDNVGAAADVPRLIRSSSGKVSSPNRAAFHAVERHEPLRPRPLHKQSHSKEYLTDLASDPSAHKRSSSRDSVSEFSAEIIRKPSPPKKTPVVVPSSMSSSSLDAGRLNAKRSSTPSKENFPSHKPLIQEPSSIAKGGKISAQRNLSTTVLESGNTKRKEKSPLRRTNAIGPLHSSTRNSDRNADLSINSDTMVAAQFDLVGKDLAPRTRRSASRTPLKEITDNSTKLLTSKAGVKESSGAAQKARDILRVHKGDVSQEQHVKAELTKGYTVLGKTDEKALLDAPNNYILDVPNSLSDYVKDPLEVKAENLVLEGKSVLSAFKALEEYRLKYSNLNSESHQGTDDDAWYSRPQPNTGEKESFSQPLKGADMEKALSKPNLQQLAQELPRSRSTKKSCEQFFFPEVQSLLMSDKEGLQLEGGMTMPPSISKACSILRAVADLNNGMPVYPKRREAQDEIERPNLLSFQFGEGDSDRVTLS